MLEQNSHYQTHQRRYDEFQCNNQNQSISYKNRQNNCPQFDQPNSFSIEPSLLKSVNTINVPITTGKGNAALEVPPANGKENTNGKGLPTDKFTTVFRDIPGAMSDEKVY